MSQIIARLPVKYDFRDLCVAVLPNDEVSTEELADALFPGFCDSTTSVVPTWRGREAFHLLLHCLGLKKHARIGVPLFTCSVLSKVVINAGMVPVFLDADPVTFGIDLDDLARKAESLDCLLLIHSFGYPAKYEEFAELMGEKPIIEDCAHAFGSTYRGRPVGFNSIASFFSFGFFKPLGVGGGGCAVTRDSGVSYRVKEKLRSSTLTTSSATLRAVRSFLYATAFRQPIYSIVQSARSICRSDSQNELNNSLEDSSIALSSDLRMRISDGNVLVRRLRKWERNRNDQFWIALRSSLPMRWHVPPEPAFGEWNHFAFTIDGGSAKECAKAVDYFGGLRIAAAPIYPNRAKALRSCGYTGDCPEAERQSNSVFMLPAYRNLSPIDKERIVDAVSKWGRVWS